jgi:hypothetical protein
MKGRHILVTGGLRSGTTWVGRTIAYHPSIEYLHEPFNGFSQSRGFRYTFTTWFFHVAGTPEEAAAYRALERLIRSRTRPIDRALLECRKRAFDLTTPWCFARHLVARAAFPHRALIKDPIALMSAPWLFERFGLRVICMIRNPLAFAGSIKKWAWRVDFAHFRGQAALMTNQLRHLAGEIDRAATSETPVIEQACLLWNIFHTMVLDYQKRFPEWLFVRHEDLAAHPEAGFRSIFESLQLDFSEETRARIAAFTSAEHSAETEHWALSARDARGSLETWRHRLTSRDVDAVIERTSALATRFYRIEANAFV